MWEVTREYRRRRQPQLHHRRTLLPAAYSFYLQHHLRTLLLPTATTDDVELRQTNQAVNSIGFGGRRMPTATTRSLL